MGNVDQNVKLRHDSRGVAREAAAAPAAWFKRACLHEWSSSRLVGNPETTGNLQTFIAAYLEGRSNSKLNDRTNKFGSLRPPQPHAEVSAGGDGACLAGRKKSHPFGERAYVLLKFAGQRGVAPAIFLVGQVGQLRTPPRKLSDCGTAS